MADDATPPTLPDLLAPLLAMPAEIARQLADAMPKPAAAAPLSQGDAERWSGVLARLQAMWLDFQREQALRQADPAQQVLDPAWWASLARTWQSRFPLAQPEIHQRLFNDGLALWQTALAQFGLSAGDETASLPRKDRRFADRQWQELPFYALVHQAYLMMAEELTAMAAQAEGLDGPRREQLRFATRAAVDALSPANFPLTNPLVLQRALETQGESLVKGLGHLLKDLGRGQLTHTDPEAFRLGETIATTPGKVVHETDLYQLIQYTPTTEKVMAIPLVIFPPWINRYYILDLTPAKSFVRWAVEQGISVFVVSWRSADETMAGIAWDDYIRAQIEAIDHVRARLGVPSVHAIGYCVAGTTLAATLAVLARRGEDAKVASATFFTAQVDFANAGDLAHFIDDQQFALIEQLSPKGYFDGRYMAATFNLLRANDLIWSYVVRNYLLGEDYPAFDLLHWNSDVTNLPARWHIDYMKNLYRDNRLVIPDAMAADGTPIDLTRVTTPAFVQAGREDHIAPPASVWKLTSHFRGPTRFMLAGSGHIAGVINPPAAGRYQYWTNDSPAEELGSLDAFVAGATEHPGSWWPYWLEWLRGHGDAVVSARGKRKPGGRGDRAIEDAPGRYVRTR
jgi:polyhydroxyalkanoate synthase